MIIVYSRWNHISKRKRYTYIPWLLPRSQVAVRAYVQCIYIQYVRGERERERIEWKKQQIKWNNEIVINKKSTHWLIIECILSPSHNIQDVKDLLIERINAIKHREVGVFPPATLASSAGQIRGERLEEAAAFIVDSRVALPKQTVRPVSVIPACSQEIKSKQNRGSSVSKSQYKHPQPKPQHTFSFRSEFGISSWKMRFVCEFLSHFGALFSRLKNI